jgi:cardiolipin synthase
MRRIADKIFSKLALGALIILLQFLWFVYMLYTATLASSVAEIIMRVAAVAMALNIANKEMRTSYKLSWTFLILFLPLFGLPAYYLFGRSGLTKKMRKGMEKVSEKIRPYRSQEEFICEQLREQDFYAWQQARYLSDVAGYPVYREGDSRYYCNVESLFPQLLADLKRAEHYIFLEYFIVEPGEMLDAVLEILEEKAASGVDVRLICDDVGSIQTLPSKFYKKMEDMGIRCVGFNPFRPVLSVIMNNRDHRKIAVIDGWIGYTGGFNLADEYINVKERFGYWKDAGIRLTGSCVWSFTSMFLEMWDYVTGEETDYALYRSKSAVAVDACSQEGGFVQPYSDSPLDHEDVGENVYLHLIEHAKNYVYIFTPYLILGSEMRTALINAAKYGVDVRIVVPAIPDKKLVYLLTQSEFSRLIQAGVKIYKYTPGFIHSKCFVVDDIHATVGTVNLDYRSLYLHFECGTYLYRAKAVMQVKEDALRTFAVSHEVTLEECQNRLAIVRMFMGALKLFAPLL